MEWVDALRGRTVGLDNAPFIYLIEEHPKYLPLVEPFFQALDRGEIRVVTSTVTLLELLVHPLRKRNVELAALYRTVLLNAAGLETLPVTAVIAEQAAAIRAEFGLPAPDAIQIATAISASATEFVTNDRAIPAVRPLRLIQLDQL
jgi:predicted nucleic acid-binding protein